MTVWKQKKPMLKIENRENGLGIGEKKANGCVETMVGVRTSSGTCGMPSDPHELPLSGRLENSPLQFVETNIPPSEMMLEN